MLLHMYLSEGKEGCFMNWNRHRLAVVLATAALAALTIGLSGKTGYADTGQQITVNTGTAIRSSAQHVASGGLYGMYDQNTPNASLLAPLKPRVFTQAPPFGGQIPNGEPGPGGDFLKVAPTAKQIGAKVIVRLPDIYPKWPYNYSNEKDWLNRVKTMVTQVKDSGNADTVYAFELWNEPNGTWQGVNGNGHDSGWGDFYQTWRDTYKEVHSIMPNAKIIGPSLNSWQPTYMENFLTMARDSNTLPDIISWHQWGAATFPEQAKAFENMEQRLGIKPRPISINEYGDQQELAVPGQMLHYIQNFENVPAVDSACLAFWFNYGRMDNLLTDGQKPNGGYWLYKWYGDMTGQMDQTSTFQSNGLLASVANTTANKAQTSVLFGGTDGQVTINVNQLDPSQYNGTAQVKLEETPWYGVDTQASPTTIASGTLRVKNGQLTVPVKHLQASSGYRLSITPADTTSAKSSLSYAKTPTDQPIRVEAENGNLTGSYSTILGSYASNNLFVGSKNHQTSEGSADTMTFNAPKAGRYMVNIGYANGGEVATNAVTINHHANGTIAFPNTTGWMTAVPNVNGTRKVIQYGTVNLKKGTNTIKLQAVAHSAELDYVSFTPLK